MPEYENGRIPTNLLVTFERGYNAVDGHWNHSLSPATYSRHLSLVARALKRTGRRLLISDGWGAYRPYAAQVIARDLYGNGAAWPGTSSHGGQWEGQQTLAMDYSNWGEVYGWDQDAFFDDCRAVGLNPGMIMPDRGYPREPWHVIDLNPWSAVPASDTSQPFDEEEDDDMQAFVKVTRDDASLFVVVGRGGAVNPVPTSEAALRGVDKILEAFHAEDENTPTVTISGEEWDAGALRAFGVG